MWLLWLVNEHLGGSPFTFPTMPLLELSLPQVRDNVRSEVLDTQAMISHLLYCQVLGRGEGSSLRDHFGVDAQFGFG